MIQLFKTSKYDFLGKRKIAYIISGIIILAGLVSITLNKGLKLGVDFVGGSLLVLSFDTPMSITELRSTIAKLGIQDAVIQQEIGTSKYIIKLPPKEGIGEEIVNSFNPPPIIESEEFVGPSVSREFAGRAGFVVFLCLIVILLYVWIRFTFRWGVCANIALLHDILITISILSLCNKEITIQIVAALLTIIGYSINDTIVISDRVRENIRIMRKSNVIETINTSINETLSRTILTSTTTFAVVFILFLFGGRVVHDFAFTLLIGIIVGTYSTIFIASGLVSDWDIATSTTKHTKFSNK